MKLPEQNPLKVKHLKFAPLDEGAVCFTKGYNLPARYIIHSEELKNKFTGADNIE